MAEKRAFPHGEGGFDGKCLRFSSKTDEVPTRTAPRLCCDRGSKRGGRGPHPTSLRSATFPIGGRLLAAVIAQCLYAVGGDSRAHHAFPHGEGGFDGKCLHFSSKTDEVPTRTAPCLCCNRGSKRGGGGPHPTSLRSATFPIGGRLLAAVLHTSPCTRQ